MGRPVDESIQERKVALKRDKAEQQAKLIKQVDLLVTREVLWVPTLINRDANFAARAAVIRIEAMAAASARRMALLEQFVDNARAMEALCKSGVLPEGLSDHFVHPLRGGGRATPENYCIVTAPVHEQIKARTGPIIHKAYDRSLAQVEQAAARALTRRPRHVPSELRKRLEIPVPGVQIGVDEDDIAWREQSRYLAAEAVAIEALKDGRKKLSFESGHTSKPAVLRRG